MSSPPPPPSPPRKSDNNNISRLRSVAALSVVAGATAVLVGSWALKRTFDLAEGESPPATEASSPGVLTPTSSVSGSVGTLPPLSPLEADLDFDRAQIPIPLEAEKISSSSSSDHSGSDLSSTVVDKMTGPGYRSVAYYVNWAIYGRKHRPQDLPVENLTHVLYAFANTRPESGETYLTDGWADTDIHWEDDSWNEPGVNLYGCLKQLNLLKRRNRNLKVLLSIGGWTYSSNFGQWAGTASGRARFSRSAVDLVKDLGFDGLDIDWEYPQSEQEARDLVEVLRVTRQELDNYAATLAPGHHFELTVACPAGPQNYQRLDIGGMDRYLDFWNLMAYDFAGSWDATAGHQSNLYPSGEDPATTPFSTAAAVDAYVGAGVPAAKIVLGMPLYGRAFENTDGPGQSYSGVGEGTWERGVYDYKQLPPDGATEAHDGRVGASWCYHPGRRTMISYDTVRMATQKAGFIRERGLGGAMWWESSADKDGDASLIATVVGALGGPASLDQTANCITYPESKYENLKRGFS